MGCDMVVALPAATGCEQMLFGANLHRPLGEKPSVRRVPGRVCASGEVVRTRSLLLPQVRQTNAVVAIGIPEGWGYLFGINEHHVAAGCSSWRSRCRCSSAGLLGTELVRMALERSHNAGHAVELLTDLIKHHGQGRFEGGDSDEADNIFLLADRTEAFAVEAAGQDWATQEIHHARAASDVSVIHQDWYSLASGIADRTIADGSWSSDGNKLDFTGVLSDSPTGKASALRRWGRATLLLEQQSGHLDLATLRRILSDHYEGTRFEVDPLEKTATVTPLCQHCGRGGEDETAVSVVIQLPCDAAAEPIVWTAFGPPCLSVYFPLMLEGDMPAPITGAEAGLWSRLSQLASYRGHEPRRWQRLRESMHRLQARFEHDVDEFLIEARKLRENRHSADMWRLGSSLMQNHVERFEESAQELLGVPTGREEYAGQAVNGLADF